jgi:tyrosine-protein phosphatase YwqE
LRTSKSMLTYFAMETLPKDVKTFLRKIASKGGKKSAQHPDRPRLNRDAAYARWRGQMPKPKLIEK